MGSPQVFKEWQASFVDGAGGKSLFPRMWERMKPLVDGYIVVSLDETKRAMRLMAEMARIIAEGAGALPLAAALTGKVGQGPIVAIVSGGKGTADEKLAVMEECGIKVTRNPADMGKLMKSVLEVRELLAAQPDAKHFGITRGHIHHVDNGVAFADRVPYVTALPGLYAGSAGCQVRTSAAGCVAIAAIRRPPERRRSKT